MSLPAITAEGHYDVRLEEPAPFGYVVTTKYRVSGSEVETIARELMTEDAVTHAAAWSDFAGHVAANYQVKVFDVTGARPVRVAFQL